MNRIELRATFSVILPLLGWTLLCPTPTYAADQAGQTESAVYAPEPNWPIAMDLPDSLKPEPKGAPRPKAKNAPLLAWVPEGATRIRAVLIIPNNSDSKHIGEHGPMRAVLTKHEAAVLYLRALGLENRLEDFQTLMDHVADQTGIKEFKHCPWITLGKSSRGKFAFYPAWKYPEKSIATISYHGETPTWPMESWAKTDENATILHCSANGELEWAGTFALHVRPSLLNYNAQTPWLAHQIVAQGVGHGDYIDVNGSPNFGKEFPDKVTCLDTWDYLAVFVDKALTLRLPKDQYPTDGPIKLKKVDPATGYLIEPFAIEDIFRIPRQPLLQNEDGSYRVGDSGEDKPNGYAVIPPAKDYKPEDGVPVVELTPGISPSQWLLVKGLNFSLDKDPMQFVEPYKDLRPKPGDPINVEGKPSTWTPSTEKDIGKREGITRGVSIKGMGLRGRNLSVLGYTVLDVKEPQTLKAASFHSMAVRLQIILNGQKVDHNQVVKLEKGLYPMLFVCRMKSVVWGEVEPSFAPATEEEIAEAKASQADKDKRLAELKERLALNRKPESYIHKWADVPEAQRKHMMWIADEEQAKAWLKFQDPANRQAGK